MSATQESRNASPHAARWAGWTIALLAGTLLVRGLVLTALYSNLRGDPDAYREIASNLVREGVYGLGDGATKPAIPTAYRPPLYPLFLAAISPGNPSIPPSHVAVLHLLLGLGTVWLTLLVGQQLGLGKWSYLSAALVTLDPILLFQSTLVMTESLATLLSALALWLLARFHRSRHVADAALAGAAIGLAVLCRPTFLPWSLLVVLILFSISRTLKSGITNVAAFGICLGALLAPWGIRNYLAIGKPTVTTTHGGYTLLLGNNESYYAWVLQGRPIAEWDARSLPVADLPGGGARSKTSADELRYDRACYDEARQTIKRHPQLFVALSAYRIGQLWSPLPNLTKADQSGLRRYLRYPVALWYFAIFVLALLSTRSFSALNSSLVTSLLHSPWIYGLTLCLVFTAIHSVYWSNLRMRAPLMPFIACAAAQGAMTLHQWLGRRSGSGKDQRSAQ